MTDLRLPLLTVQSTTDIHQFIEYWSKLYDYGNSEKYYDNINRSEFEGHHITQLFEWKNGSVLSGLKEKALSDKIIQHIDLVNQYKKAHVFDIADFTVSFQSVSAVWKIFLLHIIKPQHYPIYDQHIHRTYNYLHHLPFEAVDNVMKEEEKLRFYYHEYLPFVKSIGTNDLKKMDEAFFAFGKLLNTKGFKQSILAKIGTE